jgi:hypothetical protein
MRMDVRGFRGVGRRRVEGRMVVEFFGKGYWPLAFCNLYWINPSELSFKVTTSVGLVQK